MTACMEPPVRARCACVHTIFVHDIGQYREVADPRCPACDGSAVAFWLQPGTPRDVVRVDPETVSA